MENFEILPTEENLIKTLEADLLGRNQQLSYFYNLLLAQKGASTIAVDGKWGSGKTFFIKQSTMVINAKKPVSIIEKEKREKSPLIQLGTLQRRFRLCAFRSLSIKLTKLLPKNL